MASLGVHADTALEYYNTELTVRVKTFDENRVLFEIDADDVEVNYFLTRAQLVQIQNAINDYMAKLHAEKVERYEALRSELEHDKLIENV